MNIRTFSKPRRPMADSEEVVIDIGDGQYFADAAGTLTRNRKDAYVTDLKNARKLVEPYQKDHPHIKLISAKLKQESKECPKQFSKPLVNPVTTPDSIAQKPKLNTDIYFNTARLDESLNSMKNLFK